MSLRLSAVAAALPFVFSQSSVFATTLDPVIVSATRVEQQLSDVLPSATVIAREEIERTQAPTLVDLLQGQPGIEIGRNGGPGSVASIFMRGQNSVNVAIFIDGVRVQTDAIGSLKLIDLPPSQIERVEILRGNMGAIYGESAVGGVINIFTRSGATASGPTGSLSYGSRNTSDVSMGYNLSEDNFKLGISLQRFATDGFSAMNASQNNQVNPDKDGLTREALFLNGEKKLSTDLVFGFQANNINSKVEYDSGFSPALTTHDSKQQSSDMTVYSRFNLAPEWSSRIGFTQSKFKNREFKNKVDDGLYDGDQLSVHWNNTYRLGAGSATFGAEAINAKFDGVTFGTPFANTRYSRSAYVGYSGRVDRFDYQTNIRRDEVEDKSNPSSLKESANTWLLGLGYLISDDTKVTGLVSTSFRAPSANEFADTPSLKSEEHKGFEIGVSHSTGFGSLKLVRFETETTNAISYTGSWPCLNNCYENIGQLKNKGFELSFTGNTQDWGYRLSAVAQDPKNAETGARLARRAKEYATIDLTTSNLGVDWGAKVIWSGNRVDGARTLDAYTVVNLTASKKLTPEWTGRVKLENAFDEKYQLVNGYNTPPRGIFFTLDYRPR
jgi:vitamin B12 transporter